MYGVIYCDKIISILMWCDPVCISSSHCLEYEYGYFIYKYIRTTPTHAYAQFFSLSTFSPNRFLDIFMVSSSGFFRWDFYTLLNGERWIKLWIENTCQFVKVFFRLWISVVNPKINICSSDLSWVFFLWKLSVVATLIHHIGQWPT